MLTELTRFLTLTQDPHDALDLPGLFRTLKVPRKIADNSNSTPKTAIVDPSSQQLHAAIPADQVAC